MSLNWNKKYLTIAAYALIVICLSSIFLGTIFRLSDFKSKMGEIVAVFQPFIIGGVMAYLLNFILIFYENKILKWQLIKPHRKTLIRGSSIFLTYLTLGISAYLFLRFISPQLSKGITNFVEEFPDYIVQLTDFIDEQLKKLNLTPNQVNYMNERLAEVIENFVQFIKNIVPILLGNIVVLASSVWNVILGIIVSMYLLSDKEGFLVASKKLMIAFFKNRQTQYVFKLTQRANDIFGKFLVGTLIDSAVVGILTLVLLYIFKIPYAILIAFLVGVSNVIPFFGPFIGAVPSAIIIFFVSPIKAWWFLMIILIIQQVDGNIIAPKILGDSIGLSPFWVLFSTLIFGNLFGIIGMVVGVPVFAFIHSIVLELIETRLKRKSLSANVEDHL